ncbi:MULTISPECIES: RNA polymerase sigma factor [unclassified Breznakia]|uniref:RNA polymerase sigma factor n=1 Tax=unclassified Breznakia TaxID=2623764 RepID=UPI0024049742|nr:MULTISPECIES: RNA polymerase sigma factor [unclassified Breznakia]MDF9837042.1 RNA polymerase sigma factor (sigma-70 family) [Breznakia sp. PFB2-8]MDF9858967.1 RNA polymerase sigma factor (sigma-70 family) [Breznakia sp. PH5-24]
MDKKASLTQIIEAVQKDIGQFEKLYLQIVNKVYFWCYNIVKDETKAKDLTQEVMIIVYQKIHTVRSAETFKSWLYKITRNRCYQYLRMHKKEDKLIFDSEDYIVKFEHNVIEKRNDNLPERAYDEKETKKLIAKFIENLPRRQREVITLFYLEEYTLAEIAEILDYNLGSVKSRLYSGRKNLEAQIKKYEKNNKVKLHSSTSHYVVASLMMEYQKKVCSRQNLTYDKEIYFKKAINGYQIERKTIERLAILLTLFLASAITVIYLGRFDKLVSDNLQVNENVYDRFMYDKLKGNLYIENIVYISFPTRTSVDITIILKEDVKDEDIQIFLENTEIPFEKKGNHIYIEVFQNGEYSININGNLTKFVIDVIDIYAPELIGVFNNETCLQLILNDELSQIDIAKSYVKYKGEKYAINSNLEVIGEFDGYISITLFNKDSKYITYDVYLY